MSTTFTQEILFFFTCIHLYMTHQSVLHLNAVNNDHKYNDTAVLFNYEHLQVGVFYHNLMIQFNKVAHTLQFKCACTCNMSFKKEKVLSVMVLVVLVVLNTQNYGTKNSVEDLQTKQRKSLRLHFWMHGGKTNEWLSNKKPSCFRM